MAQEVTLWRVITNSPVIQGIPFEFGTILAEGVILDNVYGIIEIPGYYTGEIKHFNWDGLELQTQKQKVKWKD